MPDPTPTPSVAPVTEPTTPPVPAKPETPAAPATEPDAEKEQLKKDLQAARDREAALVKAQEDAAEAKRQEELSTAEKLAEEKRKREELELKTLVRDTRDELGFTDSIYSFVQLKGSTKEDITTELNGFKTALDAYVKKSEPIVTPGGGTPSATPAAPAGSKRPLAETFGFIKPPVAG